MTTVLGIPPPGPVWRCETPDNLDDLAALIRVWLTQTDSTRRRAMRTDDDDDDEGRVHTPEEIALAYAEEDEAIRKRQEEGARLAEKRRNRDW